MKTLTLSAAVLFAGLTVFGEDKPKDADAGRVVKLPVTGLKAGCCDSAVGKALESLTGVANVSFQKDESGKKAVIHLKKDSSLELSKVQEALASATKDMGKGMGTEYKLDTASLVVNSSVLFRTAPISDEDKRRLDQALAGLKGFESSSVEAADKDSGALTLKFKDNSAVTLDQVTKVVSDAKITLKEVVFRGVEADNTDTAPDGFTCPMDGGSFTKPGNCPKCGMALVEKNGQVEKKGGCCGGE